MEVKQFFCMKKGQDSTSYATNSLLPKRVMLTASLILKRAIVDCLNNIVPQSMGIADLGCASGPNTMMLISNIVNSVHSTCSQTGIKLPELRVLLNDLPSNDFNDVLNSLPELYDKIRHETGIGLDGCFVSCVAGSFHGRLFPTKSLHIVHSSNSVHWLSKVPDDLDINYPIHLNKGKIYISETSPECVWKAYISQFEKDLFQFLRSRSEEMVVGGRIVLVHHGRTSLDATTDTVSPWYELMAQALMNMASEGLVEEADIDAFNLPYYAASLVEVRSVVEQEGSFSITHQELFEVDWKEVFSTSINLSLGQQVSNAIRSVFESLLASHFGSGIMDEMFARIAEMDHGYIPNGKIVSLVSSMVRISNLHKVEAGIK